MKLFIAVILGAFTTLSYAGNQLPLGEFTGQGQWTSSLGQKGSYQINLSVTGDKICSQSSWDGGKAKSCLPLKATHQDAIYKIEGGWAYCLATFCRYYREFEGGSLEESLLFSETSIRKIGSKQFGQGPKIVWDEQLEIKQ